MFRLLHFVSCFPFFHRARINWSQKKMRELLAKFLGSMLGERKSSSMDKNQTQRYGQMYEL